MSDTKIQAAPLRQVRLMPSNAQGVVIMECRTDHGANHYAMTREALEQVADQLRKTAAAMPDVQQRPSGDAPAPQTAS